MIDNKDKGDLGSPVDSGPMMVGMDGLPLSTPEDFKRHEVYCTAKVAMHQAMIDALTPTYERLDREIKEMKRNKRWS